MESVQPVQSTPYVPPVSVGNEARQYASTPASPPVSVPYSPQPVQSAPYAPPVSVAPPEPLLQSVAPVAPAPSAVFRNSGRYLLELAALVKNTGFPALPAEVLHEIVSYYPSVPVPCRSAHVLSCIYLERIAVLRALSQTSKRLRSIFLPTAWEHFQVCASPKVPENYRYRPYRSGPGKSRSYLWSSELAVYFSGELVRQMEIVTLRQPALAQEIRIVTVVLSEWHTDTIFPQFFHFLSQLPSLYTIQILRAPNICAFVMRNHTLQESASIGHAFRSVRTLQLCEGAFDILNCCPDVERVSVHTRLSFSFVPQLVQLQMHAPRLRAFSCLPIDGEFVQDLVDLLPGLVEIPPILTKDLTPEMINILAGMENLSQIDFVADAAEPAAVIQALVAAAGRVLRGSSPQALGKCVTLKFDGETGMPRKYSV
ncbi:hypothetical protein C8R43DRAFT_1142269 [Mycena crocata]|nr:hypothetical protein C8R43DRAFT_1142269 [Mycena crocata]